MIDDEPLEFEMRLRRDMVEAEQCAKLMAISEPWLTLGRDYQASLAVVSDPLKEVYLAYLAEQFAGFLVLNMQGAFIGYIQTICIAPEWRGKGLGSKIIEFAEARIFRESPNVFLCVSAFNTAAKRLYLRLGYQEIGELKDYLVNGYDEILLRKTIAPISDFQRKKLEVAIDKDSQSDPRR